MIAIIDYGVGNLFSLSHSLKEIGEESIVSSDRRQIEEADRLILPGVGAFADATKKLKQSGLDSVIKAECDKGMPLLGICLGMQLLFERSFEYGINEGLGLIKGEVLPLKDYVTGLKIPHMGWNSLKVLQQNPLLDGIKNGDYVYFVHSYFAKCEQGLIAVSAYGMEVTAAVNVGNIYGTQFHPEKSGATGLKILKNFCKA